MCRRLSEPDLPFPSEQEEKVFREEREEDEEPFECAHTKRQEDAAASQLAARRRAGAWAGEHTGDGRFTAKVLPAARQQSHPHTQLYN